MDKSIDVLLCYRGRFQPFVRALADGLRTLELRVAFDREILAAPAAALDAKRDVEWFSLDAKTPPAGTENPADTAWRAPLRAAIDRAEMVVFAVPFSDQSENVLNEMQWAIRSKAHAFLLIHDGPASLEAQGVIVGMFATQYMLVNHEPDYPEFGHHFCGALDGPNLAREATVAAHRIADHLARCRAGALRTVRITDAGTVADLAKRPEPRARQFLRHLQAGLHGTVEPEPVPEPTPAMKSAREYLEQREAAFVGVKVSAGRIEQFRRANDILDRCRPGPHESADYFAPLILDAGAIEAVLHAQLRAVQPQALDFNPMVFLATVPGSSVWLPWSALVKEGFRALIIDAAFLDFQYQMLKLALVAAAVPATDAAGHQGVTVDWARLPATLDARPELLDDAYRCIRQYAVEGRPGPTIEAPKDAPRLHALTILLRLAERGLLALGYANLTLKGAPWPPPPMELGFDPKTASIAQLRAVHGAVAVDYCVRASGLAEDAGPARALAGALTAQCAIHIRARMLATLSPGSTKWDVESPQQFAARMRDLMGFFNGQMQGAGAPEDARKKTLEQAWLAGTALLRLWGPVEGRLRAEGARGLKPLASWG